MNVSHLLFAKDATIFFDNDCRRMVNRHFVLTSSEVVSSLRVHLTKSSILVVGQVHSIPLLAGVLGCTLICFLPLILLFL